VWQHLHPPESPPPTAPTAHASVTPKATGNSAGARPGKSTPSAQTSHGVVPGLVQLMRGFRPAAAVILLAAFALGVLVRHPEELRAPPGDSAADNSAAPELATPSAATASTQQDLSGTWRGEYVDASGKQVLRIVNLSIIRMHDDGGIEGTLQYESASGDGECKLHPRGSAYSAGRLQLSPESCSPHYPRELGVPLDFGRVNPRANTLEDGRIEAPTGEVIRVRLKRASAV